MQRPNLWKGFPDRASISGALVGKRPANGHGAPRRTTIAPHAAGPSPARLSRNSYQSVQTYIHNIVSICFLKYYISYKQKSQREFLDSLAGVQPGELSETAINDHQPFPLRMRPCRHPIQVRFACKQISRKKRKVVPPDGIEPPTLGLGNRCSIP